MSATMSTLSTTDHLIAACAAMMLLCFIVANRLAYLRVTESQRNRIHPQKVKNSILVAQHFSDSTATADNFRNLFELPVMFYTLCALAAAVQVESTWLIGLVWAFVAARYVHSAIHCTYNLVMHRFTAFVIGLWVLLAAWGCLLWAVWK